MFTIAHLYFLLLQVSPRCAMNPYELLN